MGSSPEPLQYVKVEKFDQNKGTKVHMEKR